MLFNNSLRSVNKFEAFALAKTKKEIEKFINTTLSEDVKQQAMQLNAELKGDLNKLRLLKVRIEQIHNRKPPYTGKKLKLTFDQSKGAYTYIDPSSNKIINKHKYSLYISYWGDRSAEDYKAVLPMIDHLHEFRKLMIEATSDPVDAVIDTFILSKNKFLIQYARNSLVEQNKMTRDARERKTSEIFNIKFVHDKPFFSHNTSEDRKQVCAIYLSTGV